MKKYSTEGKTLTQVIRETTDIKKKKKCAAPGVKLYYFKRYQDCTAIVEDKTGLFYVNELFDLYGPFKNTGECNRFRRVLTILTNAHQQAMVDSWAGEGDKWCRPLGALS